MLKNFVTIAIRNLQRQFLYSFINIAGLAVGMACSLVIFLYVYGEWSYDRNFVNAERIYRVGVSFFGMGEFADAPNLLAEYLPKEFAGIEYFTCFQKKDSELITVNDNTFQDRVLYADTGFFKVFSYEQVSGNLATALSSPSSAVITESMAVKYFKDKNVVGKAFEVGRDRKPFTITAVVADDDRNSHLKAKIWLAQLRPNSPEQRWTSASDYHYFLLRENSSPEALRIALDKLIEKQVFPTDGKQMGKQTLEEYIRDPNSLRFHIMPLTDIHLKSKASFELSAGGSETNMIVFAVVAGFILILAGVNFVNLATARATRRAKEVGIRKTLGTSRARLVLQFLLESVLISAIAMIIALGLAELFTFAFFWITGQSLSVSVWTSGTAILLIIAFTIVIGVLAGLYPAFYLTAFNPVKVLKGRHLGTRGNGFRNGLVVFQFAISIFLVITTSIIVRQLKFMSKKDLGFDDRNIITINNMREIDGAVSFRNELMNHPDVASGSLHDGQPGSKRVVSYSIFQSDTVDQPVSIFTYFADGNLMDVMGYKLAGGRWFNPASALDTASIVLNEAAAKALYFGENPLGKKLNKQVEIIGVVRDFHWESLRNSIDPVAFIFVRDSAPRKFNQLSVRLNTSNASRFLEFAQSKWKERSPVEPMQYQFLDQNFEDLMIREAVFGKAIGFFTVLALFISCLGLFGLSAYTTEQRTKEIGIRKALGASVSNILVMLNTQFAKLVAIAAVIAVPCSYFATNEWLNQFAFKADIALWIYASGGIVAFVIAATTVAFHSVKASKTNPAETLKCE